MSQLTRWWTHVCFLIAWAGLFVTLNLVLTEVCLIITIHWQSGKWGLALQICSLMDGMGWLFNIDLISILFITILKLHWIAGRLTLSSIYDRWGEMVEKMYGGQNFSPSKILTMGTFLRLLSPQSKRTLKCPSNHYSRSYILWLCFI